MPLPPISLLLLMTPAMRQMFWHLFLGRKICRRRRILSFNSEPPPTLPVRPELGHHGSVRMVHQTPTSPTQPEEKPYRPLLRAEAMTNGFNTKFL